MNFSLDHGSGGRLGCGQKGVGVLRPKMAMSDDLTAVHRLSVESYEVKGQLEKENI